MSDFIVQICDRCSRLYRTCNKSPVCASCTPKNPLIPAVYRSHKGVISARMKDGPGGASTPLNPGLTATAMKEQRL